MAALSISLKHTLLECSSWNRSARGFALCVPHLSLWLCHEWYKQQRVGIRCVHLWKPSEQRDCVIDGENQIWYHNGARRGKREAGCVVGSCNAGCAYLAEGWGYPSGAECGVRRSDAVSHDQHVVGTETAAGAQQQQQRGSNHGDHLIGCSHVDFLSVVGTQSKRRTNKNPANGHT